MCFILRSSIDRLARSRTKVAVGEPAADGKNIYRPPLNIITN